MRRLFLPLIATVLTSVALTAGAAAPAVAAPAAVEGSTTVVIDPAVYAVLASAGIAVAPTGSAMAAPFMGSVAAEFPITKISDGGDRLRHSGGLEFTSDSADIKVRGFVIRLDLTRVTAHVSGSEVGDAGRVTMFQIVPTDDADLGAVKLVLTDTAAGALNTTFGVDVFLEGGDFGYATPMPDAS